MAGSPYGRGNGGREIAKIYSSSLARPASFGKYCHAPTCSLRNHKCTGAILECLLFLQSTVSCFGPSAVLSMTLCASQAPLGSKSWNETPIFVLIQQGRSKRHGRTSTLPLFDCRRDRWGFPRNDHDNPRPESKSITSTCRMADVRLWTFPGLVNWSEHLRLNRSIIKGTSACFRFAPRSASFPSLNVALDDADRRHHHVARFLRTSHLLSLLCLCPPLHCLHLATLLDRDGHHSRAHERDRPGDWRSTIYTVESELTLSVLRWLSH